MKSGKCKACKGTGYIELMSGFCLFKPEITRKTCPKCQGSGKVKR